MRAVGKRWKQRHKVRAEGGVRSLVGRNDTGLKGRVGTAEIFLRWIKQNFMKKEKKKTTKRTRI